MSLPIAFGHITGARPTFNAPSPAVPFTGFHEGHHNFEQSVVVCRACIARRANVRGLRGLIKHVTHR